MLPLNGHLTALCSVVFGKGIRLSLAREVSLVKHNALPNPYVVSLLQAVRRHHCFELIHRFTYNYNNNNECLYSMYAFDNKNEL